MITVSGATAGAGALTRLPDAGVSVWLDDLSREHLGSGGLAGPTVRGATPDEAVRTTTTTDVRAAADVLRPVDEATGGRDGRVRLGADPRPAHDTAAPVTKARRLSRLVDRPDVLIGVPATAAGLPAVTEVIGTGIGVTVTPVLSPERHPEVMDAHLAGLERAHAAGFGLAAVHSVGSFPVSPVGNESDERLTVPDTGEALALRGRAALADARLAHEEYERFSSGERRPAPAGGARADKQRPLRASTGVMDPAHKDTRYVEEPAAPGTVVTMTGATLRAAVGHGTVRSDTVTGAHVQTRRSGRRRAARPLLRRGGAAAGGRGPRGLPGRRAGPGRRGDEVARQQGS